MSAKIYNYFINDTIALSFIVEKAFTDRSNNESLMREW